MTMDPSSGHASPFFCTSTCTLTKFQSHTEQRLGGIFKHLPYPHVCRTVFDAYCNKKSLQSDTVKFIFDGTRVAREQTPDEVRGRKNRWPKVMFHAAIAFALDNCVQCMLISGQVTGLIQHSTRTRSYVPSCSRNIFSCTGPQRT